MIVVNMSADLSDDIKKEDFTLNGVTASNISTDERLPFIWLTFNDQNVFEGVLKFNFTTNSSQFTAEYNLTEFPKESEEQNAAISKIMEMCKK